VVSQVRGIRESQEPTSLTRNRSSRPTRKPRALALAAQVVEGLDADPQRAASSEMDRICSMTSRWALAVSMTDRCAKRPERGRGLPSAGGENARTAMDCRVCHSVLLSEDSGLAQ